MIQRASATPRGPRNTSPSVRGGGRGGIQKRRAGTGPARVDKDGDLVMDAATAGDRRKFGKSRLESPVPSKPHGSGRGSGGPVLGGNLGAHKTQQAVLRGLGAQQANVLGSRITTGGTTLRIDGLNSSKAASNPDGGLESLLAFLERKAGGLDAASNRTVKIKKVCLSL
jgi:nuclear RNA export factor